jgi:DNA-binding Xre family transcriptional regulator
MKQNNNLENFLKLVSKEPASNKIVKDILFYEENKEWLDRSANIAIKILSTLRHNRKENRFPNTQKDLAEMMNITPQQVNKMVKGTENLTLETISRVEKALDIQLIDIHNEPKKVVQEEMELI